MKALRLISNGVLLVRSKNGQKPKVQIEMPVNNKHRYLIRVTD